MRYKGFYVTDNSSLLIEVICIGYQNMEYMKCKLNISNKTTGVVYETRKNYKIYFDRITHWRRR